jgi:hypothetical protein
MTGGDEASARGRGGAASARVLRIVTDPVFDLSSAVPSGPAATAPSRGLPKIWVDKPSVAGYFDRTQMVTRGASRSMSSRYGAIRPPTSFSAPSWTTSRTGSAPTR